LALLKNSNTTLFKDYYLVILNLENWVITRRSTYGYVDFGEDDNHEKISYCKNCLEYGFMVPLKSRIYADNEPIPVDHDQWKQCHTCGLIVPVYELQKESEIKDVIETSDNPFDISKNQFLGLDTRKSARKRKKQKDNQKDFDWIPDEEIKRELKKGSTLLSYSEEMPQQS